MNKIYSVGEEALTPRLLKNMDAIERDFNENGEQYCGEFLNALKSLARKVIKAQQQDVKGEIRYLCFSFLQSSLLTKSYELRLDAYDEGLFKDLSETCVYWSPSFIFRYFEEDVKFVRIQLRQNIVRIREFEIENFLQDYARHYYRIVQRFIENQMEDIDLKSYLNGVRCGEGLSVTFGGYYDYSVQICEKEN